MTNGKLVKVKSALADMDKSNHPRPPHPLKKRIAGHLRLVAKDAPKCVATSFFQNVGEWREIYISLKFTKPRTMLVR